MGRRKVLLLGRYGHPNDIGGVATSTQSMVLKSIEEGFDFHVVSIRPKKSITAELLKSAKFSTKKITLDIFSSPEGFGTKKSDLFEMSTSDMADRIITSSLTKKADLIHIVGAYPNFVRVGEKISQALKIPYIVSARGSDVYGHNPEYVYESDKDWFLRPLKQASVITVLSDFQKEEVLKNLSDVGFSLPIRKIRNGVDTDYFRPLEKINLPTGALRVVYTGRIRKFKGIMDIVIAVNFARRNSVDTELDIYGGIEGNDEEENFKEIKEYIAKNSLSSFIRCDGIYVPRKKFPEIYRKHNLFMHASRCEGLPNSVLEAMACGLPVSLNYSSGSSDVLNERRLVFKTGDIEQMTKILCYLARKPKKLTEYGQKNREFAVEHHWKNIAHQYCDVYRELLN